jgi:hypothetical protein
MTTKPLEIKKVVSEMGRGGMRIANEVAERRRVLPGAINDVLEA